MLTTGILSLIAIGFYCWFNNVDGFWPKCGVIGIFLLVLWGYMAIISPSSSDYDEDDDYEYEGSGGSNINFRGKSGSRTTINGKTRYYDGTYYWWEGPGCDYCDCDEYYHLGENAGICSNCPHGGFAHHD